MQSRKAVVAAQQPVFVCIQNDSVCMCIWYQFVDDIASSLIPKNVCSCNLNFINFDFNNSFCFVVNGFKAAKIRGYNGCNKPFCTERSIRIRNISRSLLSS